MARVANVGAVRRASGAAPLPRRAGAADVGADGGAAGEPPPPRLALAANTGAEVFPSVGTDELPAGDQQKIYRFRPSALSRSPRIEGVDKEAHRKAIFHRVV